MQSDHNNFSMGETTQTVDAEKNDTEPIPRLFGRNVQKYRKLAGLTQEQLSEKLGISQKHLSIVETGTQFASASLIARISNTLGVPPGDLFGGTTSEIKREIEKMRDEIMAIVANEMRRQNDALFERIRQLLSQGADF